MKMSEIVIMLGIGTRVLGLYLNAKNIICAMRNG